MPDDDYQREKERLVKDIVAWGNPVVPRDKKAWEADRVDLQAVERKNGRVEYLLYAARSSGFNWKGAVADLLEVAFNSQSYNLENNVIEAEASQLGVEVSDPLGSSGGTTRALMEIRELQRRLMSGPHSPFTYIERMRGELKELRDELDSLRASLSQPTHAPAFHQSRNENAHEIASLQKDLQRLLAAAALAEAKGDAYWAGSHRGEAAKIESKLRALGA